MAVGGLLFSLVDAFHQSLQIVDVFLFHRRCCGLFFFVEGERKPVFGLFAFSVTHAETTHISAQAKELILQDVTTAVSLHNSLYFPKLQVVEKHMAVDSNLAHEQLIDVVGGC